jgi:predicted XRE-type DNA-binding protein
MNIYSRGLFFIFLVLTLPLIFSNNEISIDIHNYTPYIDYTIYYDSNFEMYLPNFEELIYIKGLPDLNYQIIDSKLYVYSNKGTLILKYKGSKFLETKNTLEKTLDFDILNKTQISVRSDIKILKLNSGYFLNKDKYIYNTTEDFILYIVYENKDKYFNLIFGFIITILLIIIFLSAYFYYKKNQNKSKNNLNFLDNTQKSILNLIKNKNLTQQEIANVLNIKKSHLSKILNKLERQDLIERKKVGKVNKIVLKN